LTSGQAYHVLPSWFYAAITMLSEVM